MIINCLLLIPCEVGGGGMSTSSTVFGIPSDFYSKGECNIIYVTTMSITIPVSNVHFGPLVQLSCASNHLQTLNKIKKVYHKQP